MTVIQMSISRLKLLLSSLPLSFVHNNVIYFKAVTIVVAASVQSTLETPT